MANFQVFKGSGSGWFFTGATFKTKKAADRYIQKQMFKDWAEYEDNLYEAREVK